MMAINISIEKEFIYILYDAQLCICKVNTFLVDNYQYSRKHFWHKIKWLEEIWECSPDYNYTGLEKYKNLASEK